jgi:hypothetical protein
MVEQVLRYYYASLVEPSGYYFSNDVMYTTPASPYPLKKENEAKKKKKKKAM